MSEAIVTFQSQLSGVMETVFKAAMYEITRLVEDSFLEEVTRSREQVESLTRRLKWSESRRKERDREGDGGRCADCGRRPSPVKTEKDQTPGKAVKEDIQNSCTSATTHEQEEAECETNGLVKSPNTDREKLETTPKEEALRITPDTNEHPERWGVSLSGAEGSELSRPAKSLIDQEIPQCPQDWEPGLDQSQEPSLDEDSTDPPEPLYQSRYDMDDLGGFDKAGYTGGSMLDIGDVDGSQQSPTCVNEELSYIGQYEDELGVYEGVEHQPYQVDHPQSRRGTSCSPSGANIEVSGEFSCLLINEKGYLQDPSVLYPEHVPAESSSRLGFRGQGLPSGDPPLAGSDEIYGPSETYSHTLNIGEKLQLQTGGRGGRRHNCNQCSMSFPDSSSLKTHKQTHKNWQGSRYSCNQCGKTFTQACNLKVHQRIHSDQGLHLCSHCGKGFPSFSDLKTHKCSQMGDKPYCCTVCGNKFSRLWNLKLHRRIHTQEKPHQCTMCDKSFTRADILKVHQRTHTGERPYCCALCGLSFKRLDHLKSHQRKHRADL